MPLWKSLGVAAALLAACASPRGPPGLPAGPPPGAGGATELADAYLARFFERQPELGTLFAYPGADHGRVTDNSLAAVRAWEEEQDRWLARLRALPVQDRPRDRLSAAILRETLEAAAGTRPCRFELWRVGSLVGWQSRYAQLAAVQPVGTPAQRRSALSRLHGLPEYVDREVENLKEGLRRGFRASRDNVQRALRELDALAATPAARSPFLSPALRDGDAGMRAEMEREIADRLGPALRRYRDFLRGEYLPRARPAAGISSHPDAGTCYRAAVRERTTLDLSASVIHDTGLARLVEIRREMLDVAERSFGTRDLPLLFERLRNDARYTFESREQLLATVEAALARAQSAVPRWFGRVPAAPVSVQPFPEFQAGSAPVDRYSPAMVQGRLQGIYFINAFEPRKKSRADVESTTFHETVPGHHFQIALALESGTAPAVGRYLHNSGFVEGWALYAERLADEMGLFGSDLDRLGMLSSQAFRAARLVVDSGLHALGWSRERAVAFLLDNTVIEPALAASEVDRYDSLPGQATAYMLGAMEIRRLRRDAEGALGARFDLRAFHDAVLEDGTVPLPVLRDRLERWTRDRAQQAAVAGAR